MSRHHFSGSETATCRYDVNPWQKQVINFQQTGPVRSTNVAESNLVNTIYLFIYAICTTYVHRDERRFIVWPELDLRFLGKSTVSCDMSRQPSYHLGSELLAMNITNYNLPYILTYKPRIFKNKFWYIKAGLV